MDNLKESEKDEIIITQLNMAQVILTKEFNEWIKEKWEYLMEAGITEFESIIDLYLHPREW